MAFDYGTQELNIKNPFKLEGVARVVVGIILAVIGGFLFYQVAGVMEESVLLTAAYFFAGACFLLIGIIKAVGGLTRIVRFYVGRDAPSNLDKAYATPVIYQMLRNKKNPTFVEPQGLIPRIVHSLFPRLLTAPPVLRNYSQKLILKVSKTLFAILLFGIVVLGFQVLTASGHVDGLARDAAISTLLVLLALYLGLLWVRSEKPLDSANFTYGSTSAKSLFKMLLIAIAMPILVALGWSLSFSGLSGSEVAAYSSMFGLIIENNAVVTLVAVVLAGIVSLVVAFFLLMNARLNLFPTAVDRTHLNDEFRFDAHPKTLFTRLTNKVMMSRRELDIDNRVYNSYCDTKAASNNNSEFSMEYIAETQPLVLEAPEGKFYGLARTLITLAGHAVSALAFVLMFLLVADALSSIHEPPFSGWEEYVVYYLEIVLYFFILLLVAGYGKAAVHMSDLFRSEIFFKSNAILFEAEGTFQQSTNYRGENRHEASSEETGFHFDSTYNMFGSSLLTSTFAVSGHHNLQQLRFVMSMADNEEFSKEIIDDLSYEMKKIERDVQTKRDADIQASMKRKTDAIYQQKSAELAAMANMGVIPSPQDTSSNLVAKDDVDVKKIEE